MSQILTKLKIYVKTTKNKIILLKKFLDSCHSNLHWFSCFYFLTNEKCGCCWYITFYTHKNSLISSRVYFCSSPSWFPFVCLSVWHFLTIFGAKNYNWNWFFKHSKFEFLCQTTKFHFLSFLKNLNYLVFLAFFENKMRIFLKFILKFPSHSSSLKYEKTQNAKSTEIRKITIMS